MEQMEQTAWIGRSSLVFCSIYFFLFHFILEQNRITPHDVTLNSEKHIKKIDL